MGKLQILKALKPLLISHHPSCKSFENHILRIGNVKICLGCFVTYPTIIFSLFFIWLAGHYKLFTWYLFPIGIVLSSAKLLPDSFSKSIRIIANLSFGLGISFIICSILSLHVLLVFKISALIILCLVCSALGHRRVNKIVETCNSCEWKRDWANCPGLKEVYRKIFKATNR